MSGVAFGLFVLGCLIAALVAEAISDEDLRPGLVVIAGLCVMLLICVATVIVEVK